MRKIILLILMAAMCKSIEAKRVDIQTAKAVAMNHYKLQYRLSRGGADITPSIVETITVGRKQDTLIYVFNFSRGFTMIAADDAVIPVLAYSLKGKYREKDCPPALIDLMEHYREQVQLTIAGKLSTSGEAQNLWSYYLNPETVRSGECEIWPKYF